MTSDRQSATVSLADMPCVCQADDAQPTLGQFALDAFFDEGLPLLIEIAKDMPRLFVGVEVPIFKTYSSWSEPETLGRRAVTLSRPQCACLLAHSFLGSLKRPADVLPNDFRFTVVELFLGTAPLQS